jgi:UDP-GlcNAc:undecaprenyl-phosphate GlcNAc-1-phosphate transferase
MLQNPGWVELNLSEILVGFRSPLVAGVIALAVTWLLTPWVRSFAISKGAIDDPTRDERRVHKEPIAKLGGLAIYAGIVVSLLVTLPFAYRGTVWMPPYLLGMLIIGAALVGIGALDDVYAYSAKIQAGVLLGAGFVIQAFGTHQSRVQIQTLGITIGPSHYISLGLIGGAIFTALYIFVVTKTMDTIDGIDGLAAGMAAISATTLCVIANYGGQPRVAIIAAAIGGSALGFLKHNYNPAKIFMGTGGAYILGFMMASLSIVGALKTAAAISLLIPVTVFGVPIFDAFFVIAKRLASGSPITQADKRHLHHTLMGKGLSQKQTVLVIYAMAAILCFGVVLVVLKVVKHA